jgi:DNA-binding Lrp family transcriptional regulator
MHRILELIEKHSDITPGEIAVMLDMPETDVKNAIAQFEREGIIVGRKTVINWNKTDREYVTAFIELKVTPQQDKGFDQIAEAFYQYDQVRSVYLMSGAFDLALIIEGRSLKEVALFVSEKLAPMDTVISTATHFVLKKYKDDGLFIESAEKKDERQVLGI